MHKCFWFHLWLQLLHYQLIYRLFFPILRTKVVMPMSSQRQLFEFCALRYWSLLRLRIQLVSVPNTVANITAVLYWTTCLSVFLLYHDKVPHYEVVSLPTLISSSCTECRRSNLLFLSLQQVAGGATREVTEVWGSGGSGLNDDALELEEDGGEE